MHAGDRIALGGDNGTGKSTLLKAIALAPKQSVEALAREPLSAIFQDLDDLETTAERLDGDPEAAERHAAILERRWEILDGKLS